jgi:phosphate regulon transcriptional regulator PhoB
MKKAKVLVVDDERDIIELVSYNLEKEGFKVISAMDGEKALELVSSKEPEIIILDLMLPGIDGLDVCRELKRNDKTSSIPIIMLTAKGEESDIVIGLELGADDYITKPFSPRILVARVKAVLRRIETKKEEEKLINIEQLSIDLVRHQVTYREKTLTLTSTEFNLLILLAKNRGKVFTRDQILDKAWKDESFVVDRTVDVHVRRLRQKLGQASQFIETVRGVGYRFKD